MGEQGDEFAARGALEVERLEPDAGASGTDAIKPATLFIPSSTGFTWLRRVSYQSAMVTAPSGPTPVHTGRNQRSLLATRSSSSTVRNVAPCGTIG
jgi:hypothetical protein